MGLTVRAAAGSRTRLLSPVGMLPRGSLVAVMPGHLMLIHVKNNGDNNSHLLNT